MVHKGGRWSFVLTEEIYCGKVSRAIPGRRSLGSAKS